MANFTKGQPVRQKVVVIEGSIDGFSLDDETGEVRYLVKWVDENGKTQSRYFAESEIEAA